MKLKIRTAPKKEDCIFAVDALVFEAPNDNIYFLAFFRPQNTARKLDLSHIKS